jgi:hypothetical protein
MNLDFEPTPYQAGHPIGISMAHEPLIDNVDENRLEQFKFVGISVDEYLSERYMLRCAGTTKF